MWIIDSTYRDGVELWEKSASGVRRVTIPYQPTFYLHLPDPHAHWELLDAHERALGEAEGRERIKVVPRDEMVGIALGRG